MPDEDARAILWEAAGDANNRVVANALVGLSKLGEPEVLALLKRMASHPKAPFRASAAWAMGETRDPVFLRYLEALGADFEPAVRRMANRALTRLKHAVPSSPSRPCESACVRSCEEIGDCTSAPT